VALEAPLPGVLLPVRHAVTAIDPAENPYLCWILEGRHAEALPFALRAENFDAIRANLDRLELRCQSLDELLDEAEPGSFDRFNLSDVFEYMSESHSHAVLSRLVRVARPSARLLYWNLLVPRRRPESMAAELRPLAALSRDLHARDKTFFYSDLVIEEVLGA
jgi:S-adenosylmethionine-diacylglycerol 3-amino-3-carboxypropyl transferase